MAVPNLIARQNHAINSHECEKNARRFPLICHPKMYAQARFLAVGAAIQSLMQNGQCTITAIGRGFDGKTSEKHGMKRADRLLKNEALPAETL